MTDCDATALSRFVDGDVTPLEYRGIASHVRSCSRCRQEIERLRRVDHVLARWGARREPVPPETERRIRRAVERHRRLGPLLALSRMTPAAVGSSVAALLILLSVNLGPIYQSTLPAAKPSPQPASASLRRQSAPLSYARGTSALLTNRSPVPSPSDRHRPLLDVN